MRYLAKAAAPLLVILMTGCGGVADRETLEVRSKASQQAIGLTLPASARVIFADRMRGLDDAARIIAVMPAADWRDLERRLLATVPDAAPPTREAVAHLGTDHDGWTPGKQAQLTARQLPWRGGAESLNIGAAPAGPGMMRVFIFWFEI